MAGMIAELLERANSAHDGDTSVNFAKRRFPAEDDAIGFFADVRRRMLDIREWRRSSSASTYTLFDANGNNVDNERIDIGRFIRISLYGSGKYDWVEVIGIYDEPDEFVITVKPSHDPTERPQERRVISHFFGPEATNNFCLQRHGRNLTFYVIGIDEKLNTEFTDGLLEMVRNTATANLGYYLGIQKTVWKQFCVSFLEPSGEAS